MRLDKAPFLKKDKGKEQEEEAEIWRPLTNVQNSGTSVTSPCCSLWEVLTFFSIPGTLGPCPDLSFVGAPDHCAPVLHGT